MLDKSLLVLGALARTGGLDLAGLVLATALPRTTAHRLACALEVHRLVARDDLGRFVLGPRIPELAAATGSPSLRVKARPVMEELAAATGESVQLYERDGDERVCIEAVEAPGASGLRDIVRVGARLPMAAGSGGAALMAGEAGSARRDWYESVAERAPGVASVSSPIFGTAAAGRVVASISVSGPIERMTRRPGRLHGPAVSAAAVALSSGQRSSPSAR